LVLDQCPVSHPDHAAALTNLAWARLRGYVRNDLQDIDATISLFRDVLALRPQRHPDHPLSLHHLTEALTWRHSKKSTAADIREAAQLYHELLLLCPEGTYLRSIVAGKNGVGCVIGRCNNLPTDVSDEGICLRRVVLELCPVGHRCHPRALGMLSRALISRFSQSGNIDDLDEGIQFLREAVSLYPERHPGRDHCLNNLAVSLGYYRFVHQGNPNDLDEAIPLHEEALRLRPVGHKSRGSSLDNLGGALVTRFNKRGDIDDITRAISLYREALTLCPPGHPCHYAPLSNLALALQKRYDKLDVSEDLNKAIDLYRESLPLKGLDHSERHVTLHNLSSALSSRFTHSQKNEDVEEAIALCQEILETLPSLHPARYFSYRWLQRAYTSRYLMEHNPADLSLAVENFRLASGHPTQGFPNRVRTALNWVATAESHQHDSALEAYHVYLELFDNHVMTRSSVISRREAATSFRGAQSLPVDAASCTIRRGDLQHAIELAEQGRGQQ
jgi:tetratricopeptide (TPR) repeat protein